jgi:DMSO/TMAO reductase YedYZ heme-binding membrane subunit
LLYAIIRYNLSGNTPWEQVPLYINNKAISWTVVIIFATTYSIGPLSVFFPKIESWKNLRKPLGFIGFFLAGIHTVISLSILNPHYYPKFFDGDKMSWLGELSMFFGAVSFIIFYSVSVGSASISLEKKRQQWLMVQQLGVFALLITGLHLLGMSGSWLYPAKWLLGLPPISLLAFFFVGLTLILRKLPKPTSNLS